MDSSANARDPPGGGNKRSGAELAALIAKKQQKESDAANERRAASAQQSFTSDMRLLFDAFQATKVCVDTMELFAARMGGVVSGLFAEFADTSSEEALGAPEDSYDAASSPERGGPKNGATSAPSSRPVALTSHGDAGSTFESPADRLGDGGIGGGAAASSNHAVNVGLVKIAGVVDAVEGSSAGGGAPNNGGGSAGSSRAARENVAGEASDNVEGSSETKVDFVDVKLSPTIGRLSLRPRPEIQAPKPTPATLPSLNTPEEKVAASILSFYPADSNDFLYVAGVSKSWRVAWTAAGRKPVTTIAEAVATRVRSEQLFNLLSPRHPLSVEGVAKAFENAARGSPEIFVSAARAGNLKGLKAAAAHFWRDWAAWKGVADSGVTGGAATSGSRAVMEWARRQGCHWDEWVCSLAAEHGHFVLLRWLRGRGCPWDARTCASAAKAGHLEMLQWARSAGCQWDADTTIYAAGGGHLEVLKWARGQGCPWNIKTSNAAAIGGRLDVLRWADANKCPMHTGKCLEEGARFGHLEVVKWAHARGGCMSVQVARFAAMGGHVDVLAWLRSKDGKEQCPWGCDTCTDAAGQGQLAAVQWARANGCPWQKSACSMAARGGHLSVLKWLREEGCPWDEKTCSYAARSGHLEVLQWARENGCPWDRCTVRNALRGGHTVIVEWAKAHGCLA